MAQQTSVTVNKNLGSVGLFARLFPKLPYASPRSSSLLYGKRSKAMRRAWWLIKSDPDIYDPFSGVGDAKSWKERMIEARAWLSTPQNVNSLYERGQLLNDDDGTGPDLNSTLTAKTLYEAALDSEGWTLRYPTIPMEFDATLFPCRLPGNPQSVNDTYIKMFYGKASLAGWRPLPIPSSDTMASQHIYLRLEGAKNAAESDHVDARYLMGSATFSRFTGTFTCVDVGHEYSDDFMISNLEAKWDKLTGAFKIGIADLRAFGTTFYPGDTITEATIDFTFTFWDLEISGKLHWEDGFTELETSTIIEV